MSTLPSKDQDPSIQQALGEVAREYQKIQHKIFDRAPTAAEVPEGGIVWAVISGTTYQYTKIKGALKYVAYT